MYATRWTEEGQLRIRSLVLGTGTPKICVPVMAASPTGLEQETERILAGPCDLVEWRADVYGRKEGDWVEECLAYLRDRMGERPLLFTFRTEEEGGLGKIGMEEYESLNERAVKCGHADLVDLELNRGEERLRRMVKRIHALGGYVVGSFHDFHQTPGAQEIADILRKMQELGADVTKAAVMPWSEEDVMALLDASLRMKKQYADRPYITMAMGRMGAVSRLCGALTGSAVTFAMAGKESAPGQIDAELVAQVLQVL